MLTGNTLQVPSIQQFLAEVIASLMQHRSVLVLVPPALAPEEVWASLRAQLWQRSLDFIELSLLDGPEQPTPLAALVSGLGFEWPKPTMPRTLTNFMDSASLPEIIYIADLDQAFDTIGDAWIAFLAQWAMAMQGRIGQSASAHALCLITPAASVLGKVPDSNVYLAVHWWGGFPSALETHLLCRLNGDDQPWDARARWREHLLASLAGSDLQLIRFLWDDLHLSPGAVTHQLELFAEQQGWTAPQLQAWGANALVDRPIPLRVRRNWSPPTSLQELWAHGAISATLERGLELHSAAVAALGRTDQIRHRLWRGQAEILLPLIDHTRLAFCNLLTETYSADWPLRWCLPDTEKERAEVQADPLACGWGHLEHLLKRGHIRTFADWLSLSSRARYIRNELAHYRPIAFVDYEQLLTDTERVLQPAMLL